MLLMNVFLKVRVVYLKVDSTTSGAFQCSACWWVHHPLTPAPPSISKVLRVQSWMWWVRPVWFDVTAVWEGL